VTKHNHKSIAFILFTRIGGFIFFLLILFFLNFLVDYIDNDLYDKAVELLNNNILLITIMSLLFLISDLFSAIIFPFDLPSPIFAAIGSILLVTFGLQVAKFVDEATELNFYETLERFSIPIYTVTFILVLIIGYFDVIRDLLYEVGKKEPQVVIIQPEQPQRPRTWKEIGNEFRQTVYDYIVSIREKINRKRATR